MNVNVDILEVDETLSADSTNPVENKVVTARFNEVDASTLFNVNAEVSEDETSVRLSFQNKSGRGNYRRGYPGRFRWRFQRNGGY
ncbi:hypothetical protein NXW43_18870 [Bacteroides thetaiotaomicron]|nr:hypothetical protein NXW43_18870 [Bacteroides thetaiotaomicron]